MALHTGNPAGKLLHLYRICQGSLLGFSMGLGDPTPLSHDDAAHD